MQTGNRRWPRSRWSRIQGRTKKKSIPKTYKPLEGEQKIHFGDELQAVDREDLALLGLINVHILPKKRSGSKNFDLAHLTQKYGFDHLGITEAGRKWSSMPEDDSLPYCFRGHFPGGQLKCTPAYNRHDQISGSYQVGGTVSLSTKAFLARIIASDCGSDPSGPGRYSWHYLREKGGFTLCVITFYQPCLPGEGAGSAYAQHLRFFDKVDRVTCPTRTMLDNLGKDINAWKGMGDQIICMGDANDHVNGRTMRKFFAELGMRELILDRHGTDGPATTRTNKSREAIDGIWGTKGISIHSGGYLPFHHILKSDHRLLWIRISRAHALGSVVPPMRRPAVRDLRLKDRRGVRIFNRTSKKIRRQHDINQRLATIMENISFPASEESIREYEAIDKIVMAARKAGVRKARKVYRSGVISHPDIKEAQLRVRMIDLILNRRKGRQVKRKTVTRLARKFPERDWFKETSSSLQSLRAQARRDYYKLKRTVGKCYLTYLEELVKAEERKGNVSEVNRLHTLLTRAKAKEMAARLRRIKQSELRTGVSLATVERPVLDANSMPVLDDNGDPVMRSETAVTQPEVVSVCIKEVGRGSRMSKDTHPMKEPLVKHLHYHGMTDYANDILLGTATPLFDPDDPVQKLLDQLEAVNGGPPSEAKPIPFLEYLDEVKLVREKTSSGPSDVTPAMVKAEATDPELAHQNWMSSNYVWCSGYSPDRFRTALDLLIHKKPGDNRVHRLRPIMLFDIECNIHNKRLGWFAMQRAEECEGVAPEQYGSRKHKAADIQALNTRLFYDLVRLHQTAATSKFIDLVSNYDLVVHSIASLALQRVGTPREPIFCTFTMLQDMVHHVRTAFGDSLDKYGGDLWAIPFNPPLPGPGPGQRRRSYHLGPREHSYLDCSEKGRLWSSF